MEKQPTQVTFRLLRVNTEQYATFIDVFTDDGKMRLQTSIKFAADSAKHIIAVFTSFIFECNQKPLLKIEVSCQFQIKDDAWDSFLDETQTKLTFPKELAQHLGVITIGTSRGILHAKTEGTILNKIFLPLINVTELVKEDQQFGFDQSEKLV